MQKTLNYSFLIGFVILILNIYSCRTRCKCNDSYKKIPESTKEWFWFGEGSQWIYRLSEDTTVLDTVFLSVKDDEYSNKFCNPNFSAAEGCSEVLEIFLQHSNAKYFPKTTSHKLIAGYDRILAYTPHGGGEFLNFETMGPFLGLPIKLNERYALYTLKDTFINFTLNNIQIKQLTIHTKKADNIIIADQISEIWWAKGVGLIKVVRNAGIHPKTTWELIKYKIN